MRGLVAAQRASLLRMTPQIRQGLGALVVAVLVAFLSLIVGTFSTDWRGIGLFFAVIAAVIGLVQVAGGLLRSDPPEQPKA